MGEEFQINDFTPGLQYQPTVAADSEGNFLVVWHSFDFSGSDTSG